MKFAYLATAAVAAVAVVAPAFATTELVIVSPTTIVVPPSFTASPSVNTVQGDTAIYYGFTLGSTFTLSAGSFTNSALPGSAFTFTTMQLFKNSNSTVAGTSATYGATGTSTAATPYTAGTNMVQTLTAGQYTLVLNGVAQGNSTVGSSFVFQAAAVPEAATWAMMVMGFGVVGGALRTSRRKVVFA